MTRFVNQLCASLIVLSTLSDIFLLIAWCFLYICSLKKSYGRVFSMKIGSYKFILASTPAAVYEMLVKKSADYAGRPQTYAFYTQSLGKYW